MNESQNIFQTLASWFTDGLPLAQWIDTFLRFLTDNISWLTRGISRFVSSGINGLVDILMFPGPFMMILILTALAVLAALPDTKAALNEGGTQRRRWQSKLKIVLKSNGLAFLPLSGCG